MIKLALALALLRTREMLETCLESDLLRINPQDFTRDSLLSAPIVLQVILRRIYHSLQLTLDSFFSQYDDSVSVTKQAFSAARQKLNPEFVRLFADMTSEIGAMDKSVDSYKGMPLIAIDGSSVALENTPELLEHFGGSGPKKNAATALISIAYALRSHIIYDCRIDRCETDERILAKAHVLRLLEMGMKKGLLLFDRGYPSAEFIAFLHNSGFHFVMRVRKKFNTEVDEIKTQGWIFLEYEKKRYPVRVLKVTLANGEIETLLTSLGQKKLPIREAGALYFERWKVETAYETLKSKLELENFSGKKTVTVYQDFYATIFLGNLLAFELQESDALILKNDASKNLKYTRKTNYSRAISKIRDIFLYLISISNEEELMNVLEKLIKDIARYPVSIVSARSYPRKSPRKKRSYQTRRSVLPL